MPDIEYLLGHDAHELRRLELQAGIMAPGTERILRSAGLGPGHSVLDIGAGAGGVSMLASGIVGPTGSVLGIDREGSVIPYARMRASKAGLVNVRFEQGTMDILPEQARYDAVVGRYVLLYQPDRAEFLRAAARLVRPGGVLLFIEPGWDEGETLDSPSGRGWSDPPIAAYDGAIRLIIHAFRLSGARLGTGAKLVRLFRDAGLSEPSIINEVLCGGSLSSIVDWIYLSVRSVQPLLERHGVTASSLVGDLDTLRERMATAVDEAASQMKGSDLIGGWVKVPG